MNILALNGLLFFSLLPTLEGAILVQGNLRKCKKKQKTKNKHPIIINL